MGFGMIGGMGPGAGLGSGGGRGRGFRAGDHHQDDERPGAKLDFVRLAGYLRPYRGQIALSLVLSFAGTALSLVPPRLVGLIIDRLTAPGEARAITVMALVLLVVYTLSHILEGFKRFLLGRLGLKVVYDLWQDVYHNLQRLSFNFYDTNQTGNIMSRITSDVNAVERVIVDGVNTLVVACLTLAGIAAVLFHLNWRLALASMAPIPVLFAMAWFFTRMAHRVYRRVRHRMGLLSALLQDSISGVREIRSFGREEHEIGRFSERASDYMESNLEAIRLWSFFLPVIQTATSIGTFLVLLIGGRMVLAGHPMTPGDIVSFLFYLALFYMPIHQLNMVNHMLQHGRASAERIFEVIDAESQVVERPGAVPLPEPVRGEIVFEDVRFAYRPGEDVLRGIDFRAGAGRVTALVGPTGAGKTTIANLIPRFYEVASGRVLFDGHDVRELKLHDLRAQVGIVMQEPFLFDGTVLENIAYGRLDATMAEVEEAARSANAHDFISALPDGYRQQIGERGVRLSVGEKQRVAIARALLKDPPVLILDEATSSVDNQTEELIRQALENLLRERTSLVIAHRLSTVMRADLILVVRDGRIVESGSHGQLLAAGGLYADLWKKGAGGFLARTA